MTSWSVISAALEVACLSTLFVSFVFSSVKRREKATEEEKTHGQDLSAGRQVSVLLMGETPMLQNSDTNMENTPQKTWRLNLIFGVLMLCLVALGVRMGLLMKDTRLQAVQQAEQQERMTVALPARPGSIYARANTVPVLMASSHQTPSCFVDPKILREDELADVAIRVGKALGESPDKIASDLTSRRESRFLWLKRNITKQQEQAVRDLNLPGVGIMSEWHREYPCNDMAGPLIGWVRPDGTPGGGLERSGLSWLSASDGARVMVATASRKPIAEIPDAAVMPKDGGNIYLTIDTNIQQYLQSAVTTAVDKFSAKWGVGMVVNCNTGEILGMTSVYLDPKTRHPVVFNPNDYNATDPQSATNYCVTVPYEPGSAAKAIYAAAAVAAGVVDWDTKIFCENGAYHTPHGGTVTDHGAAYGWLTVREIVTVSSNIGMAKIGEKCGNANLYKIARTFGLGQKTGVGLPGESGGILRQLNRWDGYSTLRVPFGQEISVTALQLTMAYCALANGGELIKPRLIDRIVDSTGNVTYQSRREATRVLPPQVSLGAIAAMQDVVEKKGGTGKNARSAFYTIFGKTGTAQIPSSTPGKLGYVDGAFTGTFIGGAPVSNPKIVCLVSIHWPDRSKGHFGATVAAPYFKDVVEKTMMYMNVPQDKSGEGTDTHSDAPERMHD